jgi:WD40 repeat protein
VIFGGRENVGVLTPAKAATTPEIYDPATQAWSELTGANSAAAFGGAEWWYPKSQVAPGGNLFVLATSGAMYSVSTANNGSITQYPVTASPTFHSLPAISFAPGMLLSLGSKNLSVEVINYSGPTPVATPTDGMDQLRLWSSGTVLADGTVLVTGGSKVANELTGAAYSAQIWNPATGHWTTGASASKPRLYHSNALLLPDGSVLTGGGGAPGPVANLNAEIYYPPYLYASDGIPALRPVISAATLNSGSLNITVGASDTISTVTLVRTGSATHSNNSDQRFLSLAFTQVGQNVTATVPSDPTVVVPGFYMVFAFNSAGVPSVATIISIG